MLLAALHHDATTDTDTDALLDEAVALARGRGLRVRGLLMRYPDGRDSCHCRMVLEDLATSELIPVSQDLGPESQGCRADPQGFARASLSLQQALSERPAPDLVVINRFGKLEAAGGGFRQELLALLAAEVPVLLAVSSEQLMAWSQFSGDWPTLPARLDAVGEWLARLPARHPAG